MKGIHIIIVLVIAALTLGCVDQKQNEPQTKVTPAPTEAPTQAPPSQTSPPQVSSNGLVETDASLTENEAAQLDSMFNESGMGISLAEI